MPFRLTLTESVPDGVRRLLHELLAESITHLTTPHEGVLFDEAVHSARKNGKRLRAVLRLARPFLPRATFDSENGCFRDTSRQLAPLRDNWVMVETVDKLGLEQWPTVRTQLVAIYEESRKQFMEDEAGLNWVTAELEAARQRVPDLFLLNQEDSTLFEGIRRTYRAGQRLMWEAYATADPHLFHEWRKQVKYLWHQHELLEGIWPELMSRAAGAYHTLSSLLGDAHDLVVLRETVEGMADNLPPAELADLLAQLGQRQLELETAAWPFGQRLFAETPRAFAQRLTAYWHVWQDEG